MKVFNLTENRTNFPLAKPGCYVNALEAASVEQDIKPPSSSIGSMAKTA